jgi:hypothetical protein
LIEIRSTIRRLYLEYDALYRLGAAAVQGILSRLIEAAQSMLRNGRLFELEFSDWSVLLVGVMLCGMLAILY